jgi:hypothetical protein
MKLLKKGMQYVLIREQYDSLLIAESWQESQ